MIPWPTFISLLPQIAVVATIISGAVYLTLRGRTSMMVAARAEYEETLEKSKAVWKDRAETAEATLATVRADRDSWKRRAEDIDLENHGLKNKLTVVQSARTHDLDDLSTRVRSDDRFHDGLGDARPADHTTRGGA